MQDCAATGPASSEGEDCTSSGAIKAVSYAVFRSKR